MTRDPGARVPGEVTLSRDLGLFSITMIGISGMIGATIYVLFGIVTGLAGPALPLAFLLNGFVTIFTGMVYAELGSAFPEAGGGYLWVKEGLGGTNGFLAGWMSWFAHAVAGSLYALTFGRFFTELWIMAGLPTFGLSVHQMTLGLMTLIILAFTTINYRGVSETGRVGSVICMTQLITLGIFILLGLAAMARIEAWHVRFTEDFMPNGPGGMLLAMGLTFITFEGYEIIAQSGEEVKNPKRNVPRAIFLAILAVTAIYVLVSFTAIAAVAPPLGIKAHEFLALKKEVALAEVAQQVFPLGLGAVVMLFSGLVSAMSALNATTYSSSRVSFAMGRDYNLPPIFARIHPRRHTPYWAVVFSGSLMLAMAWSLPLEDVAAAADIMFMLLFLQVNVVVMVLRHKMPDLERGFVIPWFPIVPIVGLITKGFLAIFLFNFSPIAWYFAIAWTIGGLLTYYAYFSRVEAMEKPKEILMEEVLVSRHYSVLVPVANQEQARILGQVGAIMAQQNQGEVLALHVVRVPPQLTLGEGRLFLQEGRSCLETVIQRAKVRNAPVHTVIRLGRNVAEAVRKTALENASDLIVLGWPGYTNTAGRLFGSIIDPIVDDPPTDLAVVRYRVRRPLRSILVPVAGGPNSRLAVKMAVNLAWAGEMGPAKVTMLHVVPVGARTADMVRAEQVFRDASEAVLFEKLERRVVEGASVVETVLAQAQGYDLIVLGATEEPLLRNLLMGNIAIEIARRAPVTVIMVKRRSTRLHAILRQTVVPPSTYQGDRPSVWGDGA